MKPPFSIEQFLEVFRNYNEMVFPMQIIFYLISLIAVYLAINPKHKSSKIVSGILSFFWFWMGIVYHVVSFSAINKAAYLFGAAFILEGVLFFYYGVLQNKLSFKFQSDLYGFTSVIIILYAVLVYPVLGNLFGHVYPFSPTFGVPCPTTIFTFGLLLLADKKNPVAVLIIPLIWSVIGFTAVFNFSIIEDTGLLIAGLITLVMLLIKNRKYNSRLYSQ